MKALAALFVFLIPALFAQPDSTEPIFTSGYKTSIAVLAAGSAADVAISATMPKRPGLYELNGLLRKSDGSYDLRKGVALKSATSGGLVLVQYLLLKAVPNKPKLRRAFSLINISLGGAQFGIAAHNIRLR